MKGFELLGERPQGCNPLTSCGACNHCGIEKAVRTREQSIQHRGFKVGAAILAMDRNGKSYMVAGPNIYPDEDDPVKVCAEGNATKMLNVLAKNVGPLVILAMYLAATDKEELIEGVNGLEASTLHPCAGCRGHFAVYPSKDWDMGWSTPVYSSGVDETGRITVVELNTYGGILEMYDGTTPPMPTARPTYNVELLYV